MEGRDINLLANSFSVKFAEDHAVFHEYKINLIVDANQNEVTNEWHKRSILFHINEEFVYYEDRVFRVAELTDIPQSEVVYTNDFFSVKLIFARKVPIIPTDADVVRILNIILENHSVTRGAHLFQDFSYYPDEKYRFDIGFGVSGVRGFQSSFRTTKSGLTLNIDVSTITTLTPGPVITFLQSNQEVADPQSINWEKAEQLLMSKKIKTFNENGVFIIRGLRTRSQMELQEDIDIRQSTSAGIPCVEIGTPEEPLYISLEHCSLLPLQCYTIPLSNTQKTSLVEKSGQNPNERAKTILAYFNDNNYAKNQSLATCGVSIEGDMIPIMGRVLKAPMIRLAKFPDDQESCVVPDKGRWNYTKKLRIPVQIMNWVVVNFSNHACSCKDLVDKLIPCATNLGITMVNPDCIVEEELQSGVSAVQRVELMFEKLRRLRPNFPDAMIFEPIQRNLSLQFILCVLDGKDSELYGAWKKKCLTEAAVRTQCISRAIMNNQYLTNVLLKVNMKLGGLNFEVASESFPPRVTQKETPTMVLGMSVSHGSLRQGQSDIPSIATVVGSTRQPYFSKYVATVRIQTPNQKQIVSLFKQEAEEDDGMIRDALVNFVRWNGGKKPKQCVIFRDGEGLSEFQLDTILKLECADIMKALDHYVGENKTLVTLIVSQKCSRTSLFKADDFSENVPPGTVVDTKVVHTKHREFYMCAHYGDIGTSRPTRYRVMVDQNRFADDELQMLVHSLSYAYQTTTSAISTVAPIHYARRTAKQVRQFFNGGSDQGTHLLEFPGLHVDVQDSMFFC